MSGSWLVTIETLEESSNKRERLISGYELAIAVWKPAIVNGVLPSLGLFVQKFCYLSH